VFLQGSRVKSSIEGEDKDKPKGNEIQPEEEVMQSENPKGQPAKNWMTQKAAAIYLDKSESWLEWARWSGRGPPFYRLGKHIRYFRPELDSFLRSHRHLSTAEYETHAGKRKNVKGRGRG
jgi:hypothetical protein